MTPPEITALITERDELQKQLAEAQRGPCEKLIIALGKRMNAQLEYAAAQNNLLQDIALSLQELARASNPAPNYQFALAEFPTFDWASIGAEVIASDEYGVSEVLWSGKKFKRRSAQNAYDPAVWFNIPNGKDAAGKQTYARLITFKPLKEAEPLPPKTTKAVAASK